MTPEGYERLGPLLREAREAWHCPKLFFEWNDYRHVWWVKAPELPSNVLGTGETEVDALEDSLRNATGLEYSGLRERARKKAER